MCVALFFEHLLVEDNPLQIVDLFKLLWNFYILAFAYSH